MEAIRGTAPRRARRSGQPAPRRRGRRRSAVDASGFKLPGAAALAPYLVGAVIGGLAVWLGLRLGWNGARATASIARPDPVTTPAAGFDWSTHPEPAFPIPPYARFLEGVKLVLDPGHVGQRDRPNWKRGPTGLREAEVNLRVTRFLREFLLAVDADVILTREIDESLDVDDDADLRQRAEIANNLRADLLLSVHHNAADDPAANYTTVFYHGNGSHSPASLCAARHLLTGLNDALRLERHVECALWSDYEIYPPPKNDGFAVLRQARVPAVLTESSFHSNPDEEQRLRDPLYNRREAYGLFLGLARWAQAGLPRVSVAEAGNGKSDRGRTLVVQLDDGLSRREGKGSRVAKMLPGTLRVELDGRALNHRLDEARGELRVTLPSGAKRGRLRVDFENIFGQHVLHPWIDLGGD